MNHPKTVAHRLTIRVLNSDHPDVVLAGRLVFDSGEPYAVHLHIVELRPDAHDEPAVLWTFARDLLDQGRRGPAGLGDVLVAPGRGGAVLIELRGPAGTAVLGVPGDQVKCFLEDAFALVPAGEEGHHLDLDGPLARLLV